MLLLGYILKETMLSITKKDWLLTVMNYAGDKGLTPAQLQKILFIVSKESPSKPTDFYNFIAYNYGPFDSQIYRDATCLEEDNFVKKLKSTGKNWEIYYVTEEGKKVAAQKKELIDEGTNDYLKRLTLFIQGLSFQELISTIYKHYPEYRVNSIFKG